MRAAQPAPAPAAAPTVEVRALDFRYRDSEALALRRVSLSLEAGDRALLIGRNGAGKTTLLRVLGGRHLVDPAAVRVLGRPAFHDTSLVGRVAFLGGAFPFTVDVRVREVLAHARVEDPARLGRLRAMLEVDPEWHMDRVSDGQRRRVQLLLGLMNPAEVLLLDEVTSDLDLCARADLLAFLREESERGATILYATHVLDELESWATHLVLMDGGELRRAAPVEEVAELQALRGAGVASPLARFALGFLRRR
jgi:CCR4-NOT complex subunit CAF16